MSEQYIFDIEEFEDYDEQAFSEDYSHSLLQRSISAATSPGAGDTSAPDDDSEDLTSLSTYTLNVLARELIRAHVITVMREQAAGGHSLHFIANEADGEFASVASLVASWEAWSDLLFLSLDSATFVPNSQGLSDDLLAVSEVASVTDWEDDMTWGELTPEQQVDVVLAVDAETLFPSSYLCAFLIPLHPRSSEAAKAALALTPLATELHGYRQPLSDFTI